MNIFNALPKKTFILVAILAAILVTLLFLLFMQEGQEPRPENTPTPPTIPASTSTPATQKVPVFRSTIESPEKPSYNIVFDIPQGFSLPKTVDNIEVQREINDSFIAFLMDRFDIEGDPVVSGSTYVWLSDDRQRSLQVDRKSGYIQYGTDFTSPSQTRITPKQAEAIAEEFLNELNVVAVTPNTAQVVMFAGEGEIYETQREELVTMYEVSFVQSYKGIPIYYHFATPATITLLVDPVGNVRSLRYFNIQPVRVVNATQLDLEKVKERVLGGEYVVANISGEPNNTPSSGTITINKATVTHFDDKTSPTFYPTILLEGTLQPTNKEIKLYFSVLAP